MTQRTERNKNHEEPMTKENQKIVSTKLSYSQQHCTLMTELLTNIVPY